MSIDRQIVLDTETTGLVPEEGHRVIEIGCIELINRRFTGNNFHRYINPEREVDAGALKVHGITQNFLADKPTFKQLIDELVAYLKGAELIIHNAAFDVGFLNYEFRLAGAKYKSIDKYCPAIFDTLSHARKKHPGQRNSLDALCKRYSIDNSNRDLHGALLDAKLLASVYLALTGGQGSLLDELVAKPVSSKTPSHIDPQQPRERKCVPLTVIKATPEELAAHEARLAAIKKQSGVCLWE